MFNLFSNNDSLRKEWNERGAAFAKAINEMVAFGTTYGWDNWKGKEPEDQRDHLAGKVLSLLRKANEKGTVTKFRADFPPAHAPFVNLLKEKGQSLEHFCFLSDNQIAFMAGTTYQRRQAYVLTGQTAQPLDESIVCIGKSLKNNVFAIATDQSIITYQGWQGPKITTFTHHVEKQLTLTQILPFNDGKKLLLVSPEGMYLLTKANCRLIHPGPDPGDPEAIPNLSMEHAALSDDNRWIALGDQDSEHLVLDEEGLSIAQIGLQSSYPHFTLFSKRSEQVIFNSCHFYNGITIGVPTSSMQDLKIEDYTPDERYTVIDENCRVYVGVATSDYYILGDAYGNIKAFSPEGLLIWQHFLGSTISGLTISDDENFLWVGTYAGILHQLQLGKGHRDSHTIGDGNHYEDFRMLFWKNELMPLVW